MKKLLAIGVTLLGISGMVACQSDDDASTTNKKPSPSASSAEGMDSHKFEGKGTPGDEGFGGYVKSDAVELFGQYIVKWEVSNNENGVFESSLSSKNKSTGVDIVTKGVVDGSGTEKVQIEEPGKYYAYVLTSPNAQWTFEFERACAGVPPECPTLDEPWPGD